MAKTRLELLTEVGNAVQPKLRYTQSEALPGQELGKYDEGLTMFDTPESRRELNYQNQTGWQAWGNAVGQSLAEVTAGTLEGFGYLLDFEQHVKALAGTEEEFDNEFSKAMRQFKESVREEMPVFTDPNKPFDPLNSRWWASNLPSITSTLTLMIPTGAAVGAIGKLGKVGRVLTSEAKILGGLTSGRAITSGAISRVLESTMEAAGNADQVYKELIDKGYSEEDARTEAGKVASNTYYANLPLMLADTFEYSVLFRNKGIDNAVDALSRQTKKSLLKNSLAVGSSFLSEGFEEGYQYGVGQEAKKSKNAAETMGNVVSNFGEYFDDPEFLSSVVVGGMSGAGFQAIGNVIESRSAKLANAFPEFDETVLQGLATSTGQSISDLKVAAQAAFKKFKGNMSDALADIDGTIKNLPKEIKESTREAYRLGLQALKEAGKITDETLQQVQPETISDSLWKGAKDKLKQGIDKLKKWAGINEEIQRLEASGNETQSELAKKREFANLLKEDQAKADEFLIRAKEQNINTQDYEDIFKAYKEGLLQHPDNPDAVEAKVQAKIIRQEKRNLEENIANQGTEYNNFDLNSLREEYLNKDGSSEAKSLKSGIEPIKGHNKNVPQELKDKVKQLVDLEIEEVRLIKEADKLATKEGQEELAAKKKEAKIAEIKQSTNPDVLFDTYEDKDLAETAEQRQSKLLQSELGRLPDPNQFTDYNEFKESLTSSNFPVLGTAKNDPKYDRALIKYYNKHTLSNVKHVFEESDKVLTLEKIEGQKVLFKGKEYIVVKENGKYILVSEYEIIELDQNASVRELGIALPYELPKKTYNVVIESENEVTVNNTKYLINLDSKGNVESLTPLNKPDQRIHNEQMLIAVEIERNKQEFKEISTDNYEEIVDTFDLKAIEEIYANGYTEEIDNALDKLYNGEKLNSREKSVVSKWLNNVEDLLYKLLEYADNENVENAIKNVEIINLLLTEQNDKFYEKPEETGSDDADTKAKEKAEKSLDSLPRRRVYKQDVQQSLTYKLGGMREMQTPIIEEEEEFENSSTEEIPELESELDNYPELNEKLQDNLDLTGDFMLHSQLWSMRRDKSGDWNLRQFNKVTQKDIDEGKFPQDQLGNNKYNSTSYNDWTDDVIATEDLFNNFGDPKDYEVYFEVTKPDKVKHGFDTTTLDNHWIRVSVVKDSKKTYIGQLQRTSQTVNKELTDTAKLAQLRLVADEALKTMQPGESKVIGNTRIVNYHPGLYNNLAKPRDVRAALTDEELENLSVGVYMGEHDELGLMRTNNPLVRNIKPVNAKPGSVYVAKRTPTGDLQWFACITKSLREMPELVQKVKELLSPFESTDPLVMERIKSDEFIRNTLSQLRSIVRYRVNGKLEPDFNSKIVNVKAYHNETGKFSVNKFIEKHNLLDRKVQIDPSKLEDEDYVRNTVLDRLITDIDRIPFVNPFITVAAPDTKVLSTPKEGEETTIQQENKDTLSETRNEKDFSNKEEAYRVIVGDAAFNDIVENGVVRTNAESKEKNKVGIDLSNRPTLYPSFSKGKASMEYASENPNNYIIVTESPSIQPSKSGRHGKGTTMFPTDENGNHLKELSGKEVKVYKHIGNGKYILVYAYGKEISYQPTTTTQQEPVKAKTSTNRKSFNLRVGQKPQLYKGQINIEQALKELKRILPSGYTINILKELIQSGGVSAYGMVHDAALTLSEKAPFGTEYHEAWHAIEQVLPKFQFDRLQKHLTEEDRADLFAEYMMTNQAPSFLKRIFQLVKAFLQDLINYHPSLLDLFERANSGYYTNKKIQRYGTFYKIDGLTERNKQDFVNVYLATVGEFFDLSKKETVKNLINPDPTKNNLTLAKSIVEVDEEGVESVDNSPLVEFFTNVLKVKGQEEANKLLAYIRPDLTINENEEFVSNGKPEMGKLYPEILKALGKRGYKIVLGKTELDTTLGEERELEDGEEFEDPETDTLEGWQESASLRSPIEKLSKRMKQLIYSVRSDKKDSLGLGMNLTYNGYEAYSRLAAVIVDSIDVADMMEKISSRKDTFFQNLLSYINEKFDNPINVYTELYKALGDKTQPQFWVTQEVYDENGEIDLRVFEANRASIKTRVKNILGDYKGKDAKEFLALLDMEDVRIDYKDLGTALSTPLEKDRMLAVWKLVGDKIYSKFIASHLNVEGKKQYEIINGGYFSKLTQRLQRDFEGIKAELFNKDPFLKELPILQSKPKAGDFQFVIYAGYKDANGNGLMYNNYTEKEFVTSTFKAWMGKEKIHMMPILSDSPNLIGVRYRIPEGDREEMIAKIIHLEHNRSKDTHGIKNYNPDVKIFEQIPYRENLNEQILEVQKYFDTAETEYKEYAKSVGAQIQYKSKDNPNLVRSYLLEHAIVHSQMSMLSVGHLSFYKNLEDYYKRAKEIWSPVIKGNVDNYFMDGDTKIEVFSKWQKLKVLPTVESPSSQAAELESIGFNDYKKVDKTDAQTYIDLISYRDRMITLNEWTPKHQKAFTELAQGQLPSEDIVGLFNVLKPFYFNQHVVDGNLVSPVQKKDSELLILPIYGLETVNGKPNRLYNPLWKDHLKSMGYNFDTMSYDEQGRKEGKYYDIITYDTTMKVGMRSEMSIDLSKWGKQQETPEHHYMSDAIFGTQIMKLITGNLEGDYLVEGVQMSAKALWQEYNQLVSQWTEERFRSVVNEYGSEKKLKKMIIEEMINKGMRDDYIRSIQQLPLTHPIHFNKVIQIINSFAKNKITDLTFDSGVTFVNASSEGFAKPPVIRWNKNKYGVEDPSLGIDYFEIIAPIHDERIKNYLVEGQVDMETLQADIDSGKLPDLLTGLLYRIPTEGKYSMFKTKIIEFLLVDNGVTFMPDMVTKIAGLDFDIDKVRGFFFGGNKLQDRVLSLMTAVLSSPQSLKEQLTPGGFDNLKDNNRYIRGYKAGIAETDELMKTEAGRKELDKKLQDKMPFFSPITLSKIAKRMNTGKALIGVAANVNAVHSLMEAYSTFDVSAYNDGQKIIYNGEVLDTLSRKYDTDGNLISANIAELLAAFVDNGKDPQAEYSNITSDTIGTALYLLKKGVPLKAVQFLMTQITDSALSPGTSGTIENFSIDKLEQDLKKLDKKSSDDRVEDYDAMFRGLAKGASKFEAYVAGVKVANAGAGATMVDNYLKIKKYKKAVEINTSVIDNEGLTKTLIEKGLLEWNEFIVDKFKVPDVNKGTIVTALNLMTDHVLEYVSDKDVKDLYNSFITFAASGYFTYNKNLINDLNNPDTLIKHKLANPDNKFLNRLEVVKDGFLQFIGANTNDELEIQSIIDDWNNLINSTDTETKQFGNDLIKYAFYQRGFDFGVGSFGHLIPVNYFIKNTEFSKYYVDTMKALDQSNQEKANVFVEQFIANNYLDVKIPVVEGTLDGEILIVPNVPEINGYSARYVKFKGIPFKYMGDGTYHQLPVRGKYVGTNKYLQWYDFNAKVKEFNSEPSKKEYTSTLQTPQTTVPLEVTNKIKDLQKISEITTEFKLNIQRRIKELDALEETIKVSNGYQDKLNKAALKANELGKPNTEYTISDLINEMRLKEKDFVTLEKERMLLRSINVISTSIRTTEENKDVLPDEENNQRFVKLQSKIKEYNQQVFNYETPETVVPSQGKVMNKLDKKNLFTVNPIQAADQKARVKASIATKYLGYAEGIEGSSTSLYAKQAGKYANTGSYNSSDVVFVSIGGKRGNETIRKQQQDRTIKEAIQAIESGATLITDNKSYVESSSYNEGEKRLAKNLEAKGYTYSEVTVDNIVLGVWDKSIDQSTIDQPITFTQEMVDEINEIVKKSGYKKVYTVEELNNASEERKQIAIYCYTSKSLPGKAK